MVGNLKFCISGAGAFKVQARSSKKGKPRSDVQAHHIRTACPSGFRLRALEPYDRHHFWDTYTWPTGSITERTTRPEILGSISDAPRFDAIIILVPFDEVSVPHFALECTICQVLR